MQKTLHSADTRELKIEDPEACVIQKAIDFIPHPNKIGG